MEIILEGNPSRAGLWIVAILCAAFALRGTAGWWWEQRVPEGERFAFGDSESYWSLARSLAHGEPYEYGPGPGRIFRTPGYPLLLAPLFWIADQPPPIWARLLGAALGTGAVAAVIGLGRSLFDQTTGLVAGAIAAVYPGAIGSSAFVLSEAPYAPLLVLGIWGWSGAWRAAGWQSCTALAILTGTVHGMATLMRPSHLLFVPFALALAMLSPNRRRHLVIGVLILAASSVVLAPWWWRNYQLTGRFVATTLQLGASLYDGWNPQATGASDMRFVDDFVAAQRAADAQNPQPSGTFEERLDERMKTAAVAWARANPGDVASLACWKVIRMWSPLPNAAEMQSWLFRVAIFCSFVPVMGLAVYGSLWLSPRGWPLAVCWLPALYLTCLHMIFVSSIRYREPAMLTLIPLSAAGLVHLTTRRRRH